MLATRQAPPAVVECRAMLSRVRAKVSRLVRTHLTERGRESPYYRKTDSVRAWRRTSDVRRLVPRTTCPTPRGSDDTTVVINSTGGELFQTTLSFLDDDWPVYVVDGSDRCYGLPALRHAIENVPARWAVLLDEDAFVLSNERLKELVAWAAQKWSRGRGSSRRRRLPSPPSQPERAESVLQRPRPRRPSVASGIRMRAHAGWTEDPR